MAVFRVEKTKDYTVMANHHLKDKRLTLKAKGLLSVMLSLPEDWDYTLRGLACISVEKVDAIREAVRELERAGYIVRSRSRNEKGQLKGNEYVIYEKPPALEKPMLENPTLDNPMLGTPTLGNPTQLNTYQQNTNPENTHISNPYPSIRDGTDGKGSDEMDEYREIVKENIEYDTLVDEYGTRMDEVVDLISETLCSRKDLIRIAGDDYPAASVKAKLLRLNSQHIQYVFDCMDKTPANIRNIKKYLLATLFNAPSTMTSNYKAQTNYDRYGS